MRQSTKSQVCGVTGDLPLRDNQQQPRSTMRQTDKQDNQSAETVGEIMFEVASRAQIGSAVC